MSNFFKNFSAGKLSGGAAFLVFLGVSPFIIGSAFYTGNSRFLTQLILVTTRSSSIS